LTWDFRIPRVKSINASGHKFGLSPLGCGWAVWRESHGLPEDLIWRVKVLGGRIPTIALSFSRPGAPIACEYYNFIRLGREGYRKIARDSADLGASLSDQMEKLGPFEMVYDGRDGIPGCTWKIKSGEDPGFTLYDLADRLRVRGWQVPAYPMPPHRSDLVVQRVVACLGLSRDLAELLIDDMKRAMRHFEQNPPFKSLTRAEAGGYHPG
jgi:glutamate decarboxylase